jgi:SAM-dependent methyltransferase
MGASDYDRTYYATNGQDADRPALRWYVRLVGRYLRPAHVLDVGCGTGHLLARMDRRWTADGLELSAYSAAVARTVSPGSTVWTSGEELPADRYDAFTAVHVFEHIPDDPLGALLADLRRTVRPGGTGLVVVPDPAGRASALHGERWNALTDPTHVNLKSHAEWLEFFARHGVEVLRQGSDGLWNFPYSRLPRVVDALRHGLPMAAQFLSGRLFLPPGSGESSLFVVRFAD